MTGLCHCGCGEPAPIASRTRRYLGHVAGEPVRFIRGHQARIQPPHRRDVEYEVRDCGYETPCWVWLYAPSSQGYARTTIDGKRYYVHRLNYERIHGPIPVGLEPDHLCNNKPRVNPDHIEPVTRAENQRRSYRRDGPRRGVAAR